MGVSCANLFKRSRPPPLNDISINPFKYAQFEIPYFLGRSKKEMDSETRSNRAHYGL